MTRFHLPLDDNSKFPSPPPPPSASPPTATDPDLDSPRYPVTRPPETKDTHLHRPRDALRARHDDIKMDSNKRLFSYPNRSRYALQNDTESDSDLEVDNQTIMIPPTPPQTAPDHSIPRRQQASTPPSMTTTVRTPHQPPPLQSSTIRNPRSPQPPQDQRNLSHEDSKFRAPQY